MIRPDTKLGSYEIVSHIGSGGMGDVYQAHDTKLGRDVAIKVLPEQFARDPERLARFQREAKLLAALNHPNIATIHGLEQSGDTHYLVMELVPGENLRDRILRDGALPVEEALKIARQIAEALEAAHAKPIIHRDLKPANIKVTPEGRVKVLDFGLAKVFAPESTEENVANSPTLSMNPTMQGVILGTAGYMSPEQVKGKPLDKRTDVWAFGCVVFEMLSGKKLFAGETLQDTLACVLQREPDWQVLPETVPPRVRALLRRCLQRDINRRTRDAGDLCLEIDEALAERAVPQSSAVAPIPVSPPSARRVRLPWILAATATLAALILALLAFRARSAPVSSPRIARFSIPVPPQQQLTTGGLSLGISPDGSKIVYVAQENGVQQLYLRSLDSPDPKPMPETEGATGPFFSPDGRWIAFFAAGKLKKVPVTGGAALTLSDVATPTGGSWGPGNTILFASTSTSPIWQVSADGGTPQAVTQLDASQGETNHISPQFLPGGEAFTYTVWTGPGPDESYLVLHSLRTGEHRKLVQGATSQGFYMPPGYLLFIRSGVLMAAPFDLETMQISADPAVPVATGIWEAPLTSNIALSAGGTLAYLPGFSVLARKVRLVETDRQGHAHSLAAPPDTFYGTARYSPDGKTIAATKVSPVSELWTFDPSRGALLPLANRTRGIFPFWSPDGRSITYLSFRGGARGVYSRPADGTGSEQSLFAGQQVEIAGPWSSDGTMMAYAKVDPATASDIWLLDARTHQTRPLLNGPFAERLPAFSPDGRWLAYVSNESGRNQVYVYPLPGPGPKQQISTDGGTEPVWPRNGHELFFRSGTKTMAVDVRTEPTFTFGVPHALFESDFYRGAPYWTYDVSSDAQHFLFLQAVEPDIPANHINVVLNFNEELKRLLPAGQ